MIHKSSLNMVSGTTESSVDFSKPQKIFHPLSYYLLGGVDVDGDALDKSAETEFDNEEELQDLEDAGMCSVPYGDPRVSKFDLVEQYGKHEAKKASLKSPKGTLANADGENSIIQTE